MNDNEPLSSLTHFLGVPLAIVGLVVLLVAAVRHGTSWHVVGVLFFGVLLVLLYLVSGIYHLIPASSVHKKLFQRIDQTMIYLFIAGSYTPVCLTVLRGTVGWNLLVVVWVLALVGVLFTWARVRLSQVATVLLYLGLGWLVVIVLKELSHALPLVALAWMFAGGIFYTVGAGFHALDTIVPRSRWFGMHEIFHVCVLLATFTHFWFLFKYVLYV